MKIDYRNRARKYLARAKELLETADPDDLELAALKLRMTMEAVTYERAKIYADELGPDEMKTWQPRKLMERMLEVDPHADKTASVSIGEEPYPGGTPEKMRFLGTDNVLDQKTIKKHYDALGSYLHTPTPSQIEKGKEANHDKLRQRCELLASALDEVLSSKIWNARMDNYGEIECLECKKPIRRRLAKHKDNRKVTCWECRATYNMKAMEDGKVHFEPRQGRVICPSAECAHEHFLWENDFELGVTWNCDGCGKKLAIGLGISVTEQAGEENST